MGFIPDDVISEIRTRTDIVSVIGEHVTLRKAGHSHKGLCPFHNEKTPSFNVSADRQYFYCFGCHKKGDVFTFVMEYEGKSFVEAAEKLAAKIGIEIPVSRDDPMQRKQRSERSRMLEVNRLASEFFCAQLRDPERGAPGRRYLDRRGVDNETAELFQLGYAPDEWRSLSDSLAAAKVPAEIAVTVGLIARQPRAGGYYDRFRNRLVCPVIMPGGEIAGFSGRLLESADKSGDGAEKAGPKYINSPESSVYKKSKLLFGLNRAREAFRKTGQAILVEGNFDVISMHQAGFEETIAPLGTALTNEQAELLRRLAGEVVLLYDGDGAGRQATLKALETLAECDVAVRIATLPAGDDPDSIIARGGADEMRTLVDRAQPGIEYFIHEVWGRSARSADGRAHALSEAARLVHKVANPTKRDLITDTLAIAMGIDPRVVWRAMQQGARQRNARQQARPQDVGPMGSRHDNRAPDARETPATPGPPPPSEELQLMALLADHPQLMEAAEQQDVFSLLTDARLRDMYCAARQGSLMLSAAPDDISPFIAKNVFSGAYATVQDPIHCLLEVAARLRYKRRRHQMADLQHRAEEAKRRGDAELERQLVHEILTLRKQVD